MLEFTLNTNNALDFGIINLHLIFLYLNTRVSRINSEVIVEVLMIYGLVISKKKKKNDKCNFSPSTLHSIFSNLPNLKL